MTPSGLSSALRHIAGRLESSSRPSKSAVVAELRRALASISGPTKVVVSESWTLGEVQAIAKEFGGADIRQSPYGDVGLVVPADKVEAVQEGGGDFHVFDSWEDASGGDADYDFEPVTSSPPADSPVV